MAHTLEGARLTAEHRAELLALRAAVARRVIRSLREHLDPGAVDDTWQAFATAAEPAVALGHTRAADAAADYLEAFARVERGQPFEPVRADFDPVPVVASLRYASTVTVKKAAASGYTRTVALRLAATKAAGASGRHALAGSRDTVARTVANDRGETLTGVQRVTDTDPCAFCALLASRGPVYRPGKGASVLRGGGAITFAAHDHCACTAEPVFGDWQPTELQSQWRDIYREATRDVSGTKPALSAFRSAYRAAGGR